MNLLRALFTYLRERAPHWRAHSRHLLGRLWQSLQRLRAFVAPKILAGVRVGTDWLRQGGLRRLLRKIVQSPFARVPFGATVLAALLLGWMMLGMRRVPPGNIGVRQVNWGPQSGIVERDYESGLYWAWNWRSTWHLVDARTTFLRFAWKTEGGAYAPLEVRTKEGNTAQIAVTVPYRVRPGEAHKILLDGAKVTYASQAKAVVESSMLQIFADCRAQDLYSTDLRAERSQQALQRINEELASLHLEALSVQIAGVFFSGTYEKKLQELQLGTQDRLTNKAQEALADVAWQSKLLEEDLLREEALIRREHELAVQALESSQSLELASLVRETTGYASSQRALGDAEFARTSAEGKLALARAHAQGELLKNQAMDAAGGRSLLACEAASKLRFGSITLDSTDSRVPSPLDLDAMVALLMGKAD